MCKSNQHFKRNGKNYRWPVTPRNPQTSRRAAAALFCALGRMSSARARCFSLAPSTFVSSMLNTLFTTSATRNGYYTLWGASFASFRFLPSNYLLISMPVKLKGHRVHFSVEYLNNNCPYTTTRGCWFCHRMWGFSQHKPTTGTAGTWQQATVQQQPLQPYWKLTL